MHMFTYQSFLTLLSGYVGLWFLCLLMFFGFKDITFLIASCPSWLDERTSWSTLSVCTAVVFFPSLNQVLIALGLPASSFDCACYTLNKAHFQIPINAPHCWYAVTYYQRQGSGKV